METLTFKEKIHKYHLYLAAACLVFATIFYLTGMVENIGSYTDVLLVVLMVFIPLGLSWYFLFIRLLGKRLIIIFVIMEIVPVVAAMVSAFYFNDQIPVLVQTYVLFGPIFFIVITSVINTKGHSVIIPFFMVGIIAALILKSMHLPGAGPLMVVCFITLIFLFVQQVFTSIVNNKKNRFLQIMGAFCSLILATGYGAFLFKVMHWPGAEVMYQSSLPLYLFSSLILIVGIQIVDFTNWIETQRTFLTRNILIPWFFIFIISGMRILFPDAWNYIMNQNPNAQHDAPWGMVDYDPSL